MVHCFRSIIWSKPPQHIKVSELIGAIPYTDYNAASYSLFMEHRNPTRVDAIKAYDFCEQIKHSIER
jgi:hypothetical protein